MMGQKEWQILVRELAPETQCRELGCNQGLRDPDSGPILASTP